MDKPFHITIGTVPQRDASLANELSMVKASILYGDKVKLCSSTASLLVSANAFRQLSLPQQIDLLDTIFSITEEDPTSLSELKEYTKFSKEIIANRNKGSDSYKLYYKLKQGIPKLWDESVIKNEDFFQQARVAELQKAVEANVLEIHGFETFNDTGTTLISLANGSITSEETLSKVVMDYILAVYDSVSKGLTYPLFDDKTGEAIRLGIEGGLMLPSQARIKQGKEAGLAANLLERLPLFEEASVAEILDIRRELEAPLIRFRNAINIYSEEIKTASWDSDFPIEADHVFRHKIEPAVLDIEDAVKSSKSLTSLATGKLSKESIVASSVFSFVISQLSAFSTISKMSMIAGIVGVSAIREAYHEWREQRQSIERNQIYFYHQAKTLLSDGTYEYK